MVTKANLPNYNLPCKTWDRLKDLGNKSLKVTTSVWFSTKKMTVNASQAVEMAESQLEKTRDLLKLKSKAKRIIKKETSKEHCGIAFYFQMQIEILRRVPGLTAVKPLSP